MINIPLSENSYITSQWQIHIVKTEHMPSFSVQFSSFSCSFGEFWYRSGTVNSNTINSKFHLIRSYCEIFVYNCPNISCLKYTVNSNFHLIRSKTLPTNDFELIVPDLYNNRLVSPFWVGAPLEKATTSHHYQHGSIPVGCLPPAFLCRTPSSLVM